MFFSEAILAKRGPLAKVWLAAHMERKLSKTQTLQTNIGTSVEAIIGENGEIMALRLSGQLLLGVVRIYNRKAKYLLDDCNEAMLKLKMAFRAGPVDMTNAQTTVDQNAITLQGEAVDLNLLLPNVNWEFDFDEERTPAGRRERHTARQADITLASDGLDLPMSDSLMDGIGSLDGIGSADFLGLSFDPDFDDSVEVGRDAAVSRGVRESIGSRFMSRGRESVDMEVDADADVLMRSSRDPSAQPDDDPNLGFGFDMPDLGIDFDVPPLEPDREKTPGQGGSPLSPLSTPPRTPPPEFNLEPEPIIADQDQEEQPEAGDATPKAKKPRKEKKQIVDAVIELTDGPGAKLARGRAAAAPKTPPEILVDPAFVPREPAVARLLQIRADPLAHFLPTTAGRDGAPAMLCAAPPGVQLAPELSALFMRPVRGPAQHKRRAGADKDAAPVSAKKARVGSADAEGEEEIEDPEVARRGSVAPSVRSDLVPGSVGGFDLGAGFDDSAALDSFQLDVPDAPFPDAEMELPPARERSQSALPPSERARSRSRLSTPGVAFEDEGVAGADAACPIASFDARSSQSQQSQLPADLPDVREDGKGYSKNTIKALQMIRRELEPAADAGDEEEKTMSFSTMADKASRRAASSFFFELLVLSTRDCVKVAQATPYADIEIRAKDKLWERQRQASVARSVSSAMGL